MDSQCGLLEVVTMVSYFSGVSIKFEVGNWLEKNNRLYEQGAVRSWKRWNAISSILGTKLSTKDERRLLINSNILLYFYNTIKVAYYSFSET